MCLYLQLLQSCQNRSVDSEGGYPRDHPLPRLKLLTLFSSELERVVLSFFMKQQDLLKLYSVSFNINETWQTYYTFKRLGWYVFFKRVCMCFLFNAPNTVLRTIPCASPSSSVSLDFDRSLDSQLN